MTSHDISRGVGRYGARRCSLPHPPPESAGSCVTGRCWVGELTASLQPSTGRVPGHGVPARHGVTLSPTLDDRTLVGRSPAIYFFFMDEILSKWRIQGRAHGCPLFESRIFLDSFLPHSHKMSVCLSVCHTRDADIVSKRLKYHKHFSPPGKPSIPVFAYRVLYDTIVCI